MGRFLARARRVMSVVAVGGLAAVGLAASPAVAAPAPTSAQTIRVLDGDGSPIAGAGVIITNGPFGAELNGVTRDDGEVNLTTIPGFDRSQNPYAVWINANGYAGYWDGALDFDDTTLVQIAAGQPTITANIDETNPQPDASSAGISGTAVDALTGDPILGVQVNAIDVGPGGDGQGSGQTAQDGRYYLNFHGGGLPTKAEVTFTPWVATAAAPFGYARQTFDGENATDAAGTPFDVAAGKTTGNIDAELMPNGLLTGVVTDTGADAVVAPLNVDVSVWDTASHTVAFAGFAAADGTYSIPVLPGTYVVQFDLIVDGKIVSTQYYDGADSYDTAAPVLIRTKQITSGIDAQFDSLAAVPPAASPSPSASPSQSASPAATLPATGAADSAPFAIAGFALFAMGALLVASRRTVRRATAAR